MSVLLRAALAVAVFAWAALSYLLLSLVEPAEHFAGALVFVLWFAASVLFLLGLRRLVRRGARQQGHRA